MKRINFDRGVIVTLIQGIALIVIGTITAFNFWMPAEEVKPEEIPQVSMSEVSIHNVKPLVNDSNEGSHVYFAITYYFINNQFELHSVVKLDQKDPRAEQLKNFSSDIEMELASDEIIATGLPDIIENYSPISIQPIMTVTTVNLENAIDNQFYSYRRGPIYKRIMSVLCIIFGFYWIYQGMLRRKMNIEAYSKLQLDYPELRLQFDEMLSQSSWHDERIRALIYKDYLVTYHQGFFAYKLPDVKAVYREEVKNNSLSRLEVIVLVDKNTNLGHRMGIKSRLTKSKTYDAILELFETIQELYPEMDIYLDR